MNRVAMTPTEPDSKLDLSEDEPDELKEVVGTLPGMGQWPGETTVPQDFSQTQSP